VARKERRAEDVDLDESLSCGALALRAEKEGEKVQASGRSSELQSNTFPPRKGKISP